MTEQEQRIAIAEACGWKREYTFISQVSGNRGDIIQAWISPEGETSVTHIPDYLNDLNAMHEAEKIADQELYTAQLLAVIHDVGEDYFSKVSWENAYELTTATAAQRAEAFLRTIGKWKE